MSRTILVVGAYERDNFGDHLFYEVLRRYFADDELIPGSVMVANMQAAYDLQTVPYDFVLRHHQVDAVWTAGGEVGGIDVPKALLMSLDPARVAQLEYRPEPRPDEWLSLIEASYGACRDNTQAYIPRMALYQQYNATTPLIVNSVGLTHLFASQYVKRALQDLKRANSITVRDAASAQRLEQAGVTASMAPDVVHSLPALYQPTNLSAPKTGIIVQCNAAYIEQVGLDSLVDNLQQVAQIYQQPLRLLAAGTSYSHDSLTAYQQLAQRLEQAGVTTEIIQTRRSLSLVDAIATARLTISTSLHVRIVSAAYGVPRLSLENDKVAQYVKQWDNAWPFAVSLEQLAKQVQRLADQRRPKQLQRSDLTELAMQQLDKLAKQLPPEPVASPLTTSQLQAEWTDYQQQLLLDTCKPLYAQNQHLERQVTELHQRFVDVSQQKTAAEQRATELQILHDRRLLRRLRRALLALKHG